jgi:hypothetical protein
MMMMTYVLLLLFLGFVNRFFLEVKKAIVQIFKEGKALLDFGTCVINRVKFPLHCTKFEEKWLVTYRDKFQWFSEGFQSSSRVTSKVMSLEISQERMEVGEVIIEGDLAAGSTTVSVGLDVIDEDLGEFSNSFQSGSNVQFFMGGMPNGTVSPKYVGSTVIGEGFETLLDKELNSSRSVQDLDNVIGKCATSNGSGGA